MALSIGQASPLDTGPNILARARLRAHLVPDLLVEAKQIANTITGGWHGRRRRGSGDAFWQFRPYGEGESLSKIDWRRSARDETAIYVRDQEWEAAHTVWVWADLSASMQFQSEVALTSKQERALVLALAAAEVLARSGERVGWPGLTPALSNRNAAERIASEIANGADDVVLAPFAPSEPLHKRTELIVISDFLEPLDVLTERLNDIAALGVRGTLVQIIDPVEETFPYSGRTEFVDPENNAKFTFGRAEGVGKQYQDLFAAHKQGIAQHCKRLGWNHLIHRTDQLASKALVALHTRLTGETAS